eukprot:3961278-Alexandrium_andersonii.AAC.1
MLHHRARQEGLVERGRALRDRAGNACPGNAADQGAVVLGRRLVRVRAAIAELLLHRHLLEVVQVAPLREAGDAVPALCLQDLHAEVPEGAVAPLQGTEVLLQALL